MAGSDTLTGAQVKKTYTKLLQINEDNKLLDGVGGEVSPILTSGATITGSLSVQGAIYRNGVEVGTSDDNFWSISLDGKVYRDSNVGVGTSDPNAKLEIDSDHASEDFFIVKKTTTDGGGEETQVVFAINNDGTMKLGEQTEAPSAVKGGLYYNSTEDEFYLGYDD